MNAAQLAYLAQLCGTSLFVLMKLYAENAGLVHREVVTQASAGEKDSLTSSATPCKASRQSCARCADRGGVAKFILLGNNILVQDGINFNILVSALVIPCSPRGAFVPKATFLCKPARSQVAGMND